MSLRYIDAHGHLHFSDYDRDREEVHERMIESGVGLITVGTDLASSKEAVGCADRLENVWATVGVHPNSTAEKFDHSVFTELSKSSKVVGVGECGLDYYRLTNTQPKLAHAKKRQKEEFESQIQFAIDCDLPLMLHCRPNRGSMDAYTDVYEILQSFARNSGDLGGNVHFFVGDKGIARKFLSLNFSLSFTGVVTFARDYDEVIQYVPDDMIMSETDCPFVTPVPYRGKRNEPSFVVPVVEKLAEIRGDEKDEFQRTVIENVKRVFAIGSGV
jgi:TatD DNase family protein